MPSGRRRPTPDQYAGGPEAHYRSTPVPKDEKPPFKVIDPAGALLAEVTDPYVAARMAAAAGSGTEVQLYGRCLGTFERGDNNVGIRTVQREFCLLVLEAMWSVRRAVDEYKARILAGATPGAAA